jgi:formylglycine-generating enzyme required for sulfatase activity
MYRAIIGAAMAAAALWAAAVTVILLSANGEYGEERDAFDVDMVFVQGGTFQTGCASERWDCYADEEPVQDVTVDDFFIAKYECTQRLWKTVMGSNPSKFKGGGNLPVERVSYNDVQEFIRKLNEITGKTYRLPTEAEWEYAARGGNESNGYTYSGSNDIDSVAWYNKNSNRKTHPVGAKRANELYIYDMSGNVWEWTSDAYEGGYDRGSRGGSYFSETVFCRVFYRYNFRPDEMIIIDNFGFRLAR